MKAGVLLKDLSSSQLAFLTIGGLNKIADSSKDDAIAFVKHMARPCAPIHFACLNMCEAIVFDGLLISTDIDTATFALNINTNCKRIFYVWDLEWLRKKKDFLSNVKVYRDERMTLVARSEEHAKLIENYCNRKVDYIIENFNIPEICNEFCE